MAIETGSPLDNAGTLPRAPFTGEGYVAADEAMARRLELAEIEAEGTDKVSKAYPPIEIGNKAVQALVKALQPHDDKASRNIGILPYSQSHTYSFK